MICVTGWTVWFVVFVGETAFLMTLPKPRRPIAEMKTRMRITCLKRFSLMCRCSQAPERVPIGIKSMRMKPA